MRRGIGAALAAVCVVWSGLGHRAAAEEGGEAVGGVGSLLAERETSVKGFFLSRAGYAYDGSNLPFSIGVGGYVDASYPVGQGLLRMSLLGDYRNLISEELRVERFNADLWHAYYEVMLGDHLLTAGRQVLENENGWKNVEMSLIEAANPLNLRDASALTNGFLKVPLEMLSWRYARQRAYLSYWRPGILPSLSEASGTVTTSLSFSNENLSADMNDLVVNPEFPIQMGFRGAFELGPVGVFPSGQVLLESPVPPVLEVGLRGTPGKGIGKVNNITEQQIGESLSATGKMPVDMEPTHYFLVGVGVRTGLLDQTYPIGAELAYTPSRRMLDEDWELERTAIAAGAVQIERTIGRLILLDEFVYATTTGDEELIGLDRHNFADVVVLQYIYEDNWRPRVMAAYVHGEGVVLAPQFEYQKDLVTREHLEGTATRIQSLTVRIEGTIVKGSPVLGYGALGEVLPVLEPSSSVRLSLRYDL